MDLSGSLLKQFFDVRLVYQGFLTPLTQQHLSGLSRFSNTFDTATFFNPAILNVRWTPGVIVD